MRKIDLGQGIQILANVGVIASIVFLAVQVRQTNRAVMGAAYQARALAMMGRGDLLGESNYLAPLITKAETSGWDALSNEEKGRVNFAGEGAFLSR
jgi:hypothetical protein